MNVVNNVRQFLDTNKALNSRFIVAVSGGKDSMALLHVCTALKLDIVAAHCNFMLRGEASLLDEAFVTKYCHDHNIPIATNRFHTKEQGAEWKLSTQETARRLRYDWFEQLRNKHQAVYTLTAHHANDAAETFFLNLLRGSGMKGLRGIPARNGNILRPLLQTPVKEIEAYIAQAGIPYREDASNHTDAYKRNYIRHHLIPLLSEVNDQALEHIAQTMHLLSESYQLLVHEFDSLKPDYTATAGDSFEIDLEKLDGHPQKQLLLFEWLTPFNFNASVITSIAGEKLITGNKWFSDTHIALYNRGKLLVTPSGEDHIPEIRYTEWPDLIRFGKHTYQVSQQESIPKDFVPGTLYLDKDRITFPLTVRTWKQGDVFKPLGMNQEKKVSDFFIDAKINLNEKEQAMIVAHEHGIIAVAPYRISDPYKITSSTRHVIVLTKAG